SRGRNVGLRGHRLLLSPPVKPQNQGMLVRDQVRECDSAAFD
ncbi:hypothetical protein AVEN_104303-1, partial [Araneus ventricosus]